MLHQRGWVYGDIVILNRTVLGGHWLDMHDLESLVFEFVNGAREDIVSFALQFGCGTGRPFFCGERSRIEAIGVRLTRRVFRLKLHLGSERGGSLGLVVEPARGGDQHEDNDEDYGQVVRPTAALVGPENGADNASP